MKKLNLFIAGIFLIFTLSCGISQILQIIDTIATVVIKASEVSGLIPPIYATYINAALTCSEFAANETASTDSQAVKATKIVEVCAKSGSQFVPSGLPSNLFNLALSVGTEIDKLLSAQGSIQAHALLSRSRPEVMKPSDIQHLNETVARVHLAHVKFRK